MRIIMARIKLEEEKGKVKLTCVVDIRPFIEANAKEKTLAGKGFSKKRTLRKIGSIPIEVLLTLPRNKAVEIMTDDNAMRKFLKEHPEFRVSEGDI